MDPSRYHSKDKGCEIYPDKKSWTHIVQRYSRHYCKSHQVFLGHFKETGASDRGWEIHFYFGEPSIPDLARYEKVRAATLKAARAKQERRIINKKI